MFDNHDDDDMSASSAISIGQIEATPKPADKHENDDQVLAAKETTLVNRSKIAVYLVVLLAAAAMGVATYFFMKGEEKAWYEDEVSVVYSREQEREERCGLYHIALTDKISPFNCY